MRQLLFIINCCIALYVSAQSPIVTTVDRDSILMGEEVKLGITITTSAQDLVVFPEQDRIGAMEVIESYPIDSIRKNDKIQLFKQYGLTQWDSGNYTIPRLSILKNDKQLLTDSLLVKVREVQVDTSKQKMFPIKEDIIIADNRPTDWSWLWWLLLLIPIGLVVMALSRKRTKKTYEETLQPYEWTKYRLEKLDESQLMEQRRVKEYYTELTYVIRKYIDSKVYGQSLESTTAQLLSELKIVMADRGMNITTTTENRLQEILERADLVKFAGITPDAITAREDRLHTNDIIYNIHQVLPPPTQEELMQDARYRRQQEIKQRVKKISYAAVGVVIAILIALGTWTYLDGVDEVKDQLLGNELRTLQEQQWISSEYGMPEVSISTPDVLVRRDESALPDALQPYVAVFDNFQSGENGDALTVNVSTMLFNKDAQVQQLNPDNLLGPLTTGLEKEGATNIIMLDSDLEHKDMKGLSFTGSFDLDGSSFEYDMWIFSQSGGMQQVFVTHRKETETSPDRQYGKIIKERILQSVSIKELPGAKKQKTAQ